MRLESLENGHETIRKVEMGFMSLLGLPPLDIVRTFLYRPDFFGKPFVALVNGVLRGNTSSWTVTERELLATFVSSRNQCVF
ncbi:MAG TPA: hypothetical protein VE685_23330 [Thermoanaerobaculia bacterium]|nr:hypothetical protein [Thermoanaerobaculia bacterium]